MQSGQPEESDKPGITNIAIGTYSGVETAMEIIINSESKWEKKWNKIYAGTTPQPELPEINFENEVVIAVFMGYRSTGGFRIEITGVEKSEDKFKVHVKTTSPGPGDLVTTAITSPFHVIKVDIPGGDFVFVRQ